MYTVLVVPERKSAVRRYTLSRRRLVQAAVGGTILLVCIALLLVHYVWLVRRAAELGPLHEENAALVVHLRQIQVRLQAIDASMQRIDAYTERIRNMARLHDAGRHLAMGAASPGPNGRAPEVLYAKGERIDAEDEAIDSSLARRLIDHDMDRAQNATSHSEELARHVHDDFAGEREIFLATTPSIRPVRSQLLASAFGMRTDPYMGRPAMHKGVDFAAEQGDAVVAPADAVVAFAGNRGHGYGQTVVLDHGYGLQTHFAHLQHIDVALGERLRRGQVLGQVGNSGRSTVAHLHYEVRLQGIPTDPMSFILD